MDFAKNLLAKYGWREGEGLGKNSDGMVAPLKTKLKHSNAGLGLEQGKDITNNWWDRVYNEAAGNIVVQENGAAGVSMRQREHNAVEITTKDYSIAMLRKKAAGKSSGYGVFLKASTLLGNANQEEEVVDRVQMEDVAFAPIKPMSDAELLAACGGRTAHKCARHGMKQSGKLARIEEQNSKLLQELKAKSFQAVIASNDWKVANQKKKGTKKNKRKEQRWLERKAETDPKNALADMVHHADYVVSKSRKKQKATRKTDEMLAKEMNSMFGTLPEDDGVEPEPKPSIEDELDIINEKIRKLDHNSVTIKKKEKKKKNKKNKKSKDNARDDGDIAMDPLAKYRKDYRPDLKRNNVLLKTVPDEVVPASGSSKPVRLLRSDSSDGSDDEDVVQKVNEEQNRYWVRMRATVPKINIIEPTEDDQLALAQEFKERHRNGVKRVSGKRKKTKRKDRQLAKLADNLSKNL